MLVEIQDRSLFERLRSLLPRPDAPLDEAIRRLLEGRRDGVQLSTLADLLSRAVERVNTIANSLTAVNTVAESLATVGSQAERLERIAASLESLSKTLENVLEKLAQASKIDSNAVRFIIETHGRRIELSIKVEELSAQKAADGDGVVHVDGEWAYFHVNKTQVGIEKLRATGRQCFSYGEIKQALGFRPSGKILKIYFEKNGDGLYCLKKEEG